MLSWHKCAKCFGIYLMFFLVHCRLSHLCSPGEICKAWAVMWLHFEWGMFVLTLFYDVGHCSSGFFFYMILEFETSVKVSSQVSYKLAEFCEVAIGIKWWGMQFVNVFGRCKLNVFSFVWVRVSATLFPSTFECLWKLLVSCFILGSIFSMHELYVLLS